MAKHPRLKQLSALIMVFLFLFTGCTSSAERASAKNHETMEAFHSSDKTRKQYSDYMYNIVKKLSEKDGARMAGTQEEKPYIDFVSNELKNDGLEVKAQEFPLDVSEAKSIEVNISSPMTKKIDAKYWRFGIGTAPKGLQAEVVPAGEGLPMDISAAKLKGKIALIKRGDEPVYQKVERATAAGAIAVLFYKNFENELLSGTLVKPLAIPALLIKSEDAKDIERAFSNKKKTTAFIKLDVEMSKSSSKNIIAEKNVTNKYPDAKTLIIGAHYDCVDTPGANDNASGTSVMLGAAKLLSTFDLKCNVRFIAFGGEELGLVGSAYYVKNLTREEKKNIIGMINLDMVGQGNIFSIGAIDRKSQYPILSLAEDQLRKYKYHFQRADLANSDSASFEGRRVQVVYFENSPYTALHTDGDTPEKIQPEMLVKTLETVVNMGIEIGDDPEKYQF